jgi:hypothetical protein
VRDRLLPALLRTVRGYGLLVWAYLALNAVTHPETLRMQLTHFAPWPAEGDTAVLCFAASAVAFFVLRLRRSGRSAC